MARRSKYTPDVVNRILDAISKGATYELACHYGGIAKDTFYNWLNTKPDFSDAIKNAEGSAVVKWLEQIDKAAEGGTWQAAAWKLERRYPHQYGRTVQEFQGEVKVDYSDHSLADLDREVMAVLDRGRTRAARRHAGGEAVQVGTTEGPPEPDSAAG